MFCRMVCSSELEMHFHLASHARKYKCPACPESFHVEFLLDRHIQTHHSQKETSSPNRGRESANGGHNLSTTSSCSTNSTPSTATAVSSTAQPASTTNTVTGLDYLHLHGQMAAMAAAAAWPSLYQTAANKFYSSNPLQVDTLSQLKHPQQLLHGFYDTMLGKAQAQQQQQRGAFLPEPSSGGKKNPFAAGHSPNASANATANALLGLGYGGASLTSGNSQQPRTSTHNGSSSGLYSPEEGPNGGSSVATSSSKLYSPIAMIQRYGEGGVLHSTPGAVPPTTTGCPSRTESPTPSGQQLLLAAHSSLSSLPEHHPEQQQSSNRKTAQQQSGPKTSSGTITPQLIAPGSNSCYSCGICERSDFTTESEVQTHRKIVHNLKTGVSLRCAYCNGDFRSRNELENHMKVAHNTGGGKHKCLICDEIFPSPAVLAEHKLTHCKVGASGRCSHCSLPLPDAHTFKQHLPAHQQIGGSSSGSTGGGTITSTNGSANGGTSGTGNSSTGQSASSSAGANLSGTGTSSNTNAQDQDRFPQQCICCRQTLNSEFEISLHAKFHTKTAETNERTCALCLEPLPSQPESNTKICDPCLKRHNFPTKLLSMNFLKPATPSLVPTPTHGGSSAAGVVVPPAHGTTIGNSVAVEGRPPLPPPPPTSSGSLQQDPQHPGGVRDCSSSALFQCNLCKKPLPSAQKLQEHLIDHTFAGCEERGYVCYLCSAVFTSSAGLQTHLPLAHSNAAAKPYDCERCGVAYFFRAELEHHLIDHELGKAMRPSSFELASSDDWHTMVQQRSPMGEDDGGGHTGHIKQEQCEPDQEQEGSSSPYHQKDEDSDDGNDFQQPRNGEETNEVDMEQEQQEDEDNEQTHVEVNNGGQAEQDDEDGGRDDAAVGTEECNDAADDDDDDDDGDVEDEEHQERQEEQEDEEEYIEVEHTTLDDGGRGGKQASDERLRRSNLLINGGKDCSALTATTTATTLPVVTAAE